MITAAERASAVRRALRMMRRAGVSLAPGDPERVEVADFGLGALPREGAQILTVVESPRLAAKIIALFPGQTLPEHWHPPLGPDPGKEETVLVVWGTLAVSASGETGPLRYRPPAATEKYYTARHQEVLAPGQQLYLPPGTRHWFKAGPRGAVAWSFSSTAHDVKDIFTNPDVVRTTMIQG